MEDSKSYQPLPTKIGMDAKNHVIPKLTKSQHSILEMLKDVPSAISAQDLHMMLRQQKTIGLATIYRALDTLKIYGLVKSRMGNQGEFLYSLIAKDTHYLTCLHCRQSTQLERCPFPSLDQNLAKDDSFKIYYHTLEFFGLCATCHDIDNSPEIF